MSVWIARVVILLIILSTDHLSLQKRSRNGSLSDLIILPKPPIYLSASYDLLRGIFAQEYVALS